MSGKQSAYYFVSERPMMIWVNSTFIDSELAPSAFGNKYLDALKQEIESGLVYCSVEQVSKKVTKGETPIWRGDTYVDDGVLFIRSGEVNDLWLDLSSLTKITPSVHKRMKRSVLQPGDILLNIVGASIGRCAVLPETIRDANINQAIALIRPQSINGYFLAAYISCKYGQNRIARFQSGVARDNLDLYQVSSLMVPVPPRPVQEYIGAKVRLAERCRAQAKELWETSERLLSDALGIPLNSGYFEKVDSVGLQSDSYRLVSTVPMTAWVRSDLVEHELGPQYFHPRRANVILKLQSSGVELERLADLATRKSERLSADKVLQVSYYVGLADIDSTTGYFEPVPVQQAGILGTSTLFKSGDILFSKLRPYLNKVSICPAHIAQACGSTELLVYRAHRSTLPYYVFFVVKSNLGLYQIIDVTVGSTLPRVDPEIVDDILVPIIPIEQQQIIDANIHQVFALRYWATQLVREAKADVEALVEGRLDMDGIIAGRIKPPVWKDIGL